MRFSSRWDDPGFRSFKRNELRSELWEEDNPGLAAYREQQRREKAQINILAHYKTKFFYDFVLAGWATTQEDPEIHAWVTKVLAYQRRPWMGDLLEKLGGLSPKSKEAISDFIDDYLKNDWGDKWSGGYWMGGKFYVKDDPSNKKNLPPRFQRYEALAGQFKPYTPSKRVVDSDALEKIQILETLKTKIQDPTVGVVLEAYRKGEKPSEDQLKKIRNLLYRSKMAPEADKFRVASSRLARILIEEGLL